MRQNITLLMLIIILSTIFDKSDSLHILSINYSEIFFFYFLSAILLLFERFWPSSALESFFKNPMLDFSADCLFFPYSCFHFRKSMNSIIYILYYINFSLNIHFFKQILYSISILLDIINFLIHIC